MEIKDYILKKADKIIKIKLSDMKNFFSDKKAIEKNIRKNPLIYTVFTKKEKDMEFTLTVIEPGKIGKEHFMTRGHYHKKPCSELYILFEGKGILLLQDKTCKAIPMEKNKIYVVKPSQAHRAINIGNSKLKFLSIYPSKAGHDYKKIEQRGFQKKF